MENKHYWYLKRELLTIFVAVTVFAGSWLYKNNNIIMTVVFGFGSLVATIEHLLVSHKLKNQNE